MLPAPALYLRTLRILHLSFCIGVTMFALVSVFLKTQHLIDPSLASLEHILLPVAGVIAMAGLGASVLLFRSRLEAVRSMATLDRKLDAYRGAQIMRWALAEVPALLIVVLSLLTTSPLFLVFAAAPLVYLIGSRPPASADQASQTMNISWEDRNAWEQEA